MGTCSFLLSYCTYYKTLKLGNDAASKIDYFVTAYRCHQSCDLNHYIFIFHIVLFTLPFKSTSFVSLIFTV